MSLINAKRLKPSDEMKGEEEVKDVMAVELSVVKEELSDVKEELSKAKEELSKITNKHEDLVEKLRDRVKCPVCLEVPSKTPVYVCSNGHVVCVSCVRAMCPMCRTGMVLNNNILAIAVVENIDHQCKDCKLYFNFEYLAQHKKECKHRQVKCPDFGCDNMVCLSNIKEHVINGCVGKATICRKMPCVFTYIEYRLVGNECNFDLRLVSFEVEGKYFFFKIARRPLHGRDQWMFYVQMAANAEETSNYTATILVFRSGESPGEGKHCHRYSGDICPIDVSSLDEAERQGFCLIVMDCLMSKLLEETNGMVRFSVWVNIGKTYNLFEEDGN